jgi:hypothetical protein
VNDPAACWKLARTLPPRRTWVLVLQRILGGERELGSLEGIVQVGQAGGFHGRTVGGDDRPQGEAAQHQQQTDEPRHGEPPGDATAPPSGAAWPSRR